ncbi:condensation domain-containing protein [Streptomyces sp. NPDC021020]|uniref:condensation domain-containing protein n=1 Tax=Streptomyces sp. NPDC021020 TaxID=3365109 RepID=UPI0037942CEB
MTTAPAPVRDAARPTGEDAGAARLRARLRWPALARSAPQDAPRLALLSTYTVDPLVPYLGTALADHGVTARLWVAPFHQIERQCLEEGSATARFAPQFVVAAPRLEDLWAGRPLPLLPDPGAYEADLRYAAEACADAAGRWGAELVFVLPPVPELRPAGVGDDGNPDGVFAAAVRAREGVRALLADRGHVTVVDAEAVVRAAGSRNAYRPALLATARVPYSEEVFDLLGRRIARAVALRRAPAAPLVVLDARALDTDGAARSQGDRGHTDLETGLTAYLAEAVRAGARVALCGADPDARTAPDGLPVTAWSGPAGRGCADQVRELAPGGEPVVFLSPDAAAVAEVAAQVPHAVAVSLPEDRESWPALAAGVLDVRRQGAAHGTARPPAAALPAQAPTLDAFLASLRLEVRVEELSTAAGFEAAEDLTVRVSEFHLDGEVWPAERFAGLAPGHVVWGISVTDRFGDHGMCGTLVARPEGRALAVDCWALTCPVLGKGVEAEVHAALARLAAEHGCAVVRFGYRATDRNEVLRHHLAALAPDAVPGPGEPGGPVEVPVSALERPPAVPDPAVPAPAAEPAAARTVVPRARRRPAVRRPAAGGFTTASQILDAVQAGSRAARAGAGEAGGEAVAPRTAMERRLLDVFAEVLDRPGIGVEERFFAYGDSMLAVRLIARANKAGLRLTLRQVFQRQTVAALAAVAVEAAEEPGGTHTAAAEAPGGAAPLLPLQEWFFGLDLAEPGHFNQSQRFELPSDVDVAALEQAVAALLRQHPSLRMRFTRTAAGTEQADPGAPAAPPFAHIDLGSVPADGLDTALAGHELAVHRGMSPADGQLAAFRLFTFGDRRPPHLMVAFHHLAIDGITWRLLLGDLQDAYRQAERGEPVVLGPAGHPVLAWARRLHAFAQSEEVRAELPRWLAPERRAVAPLPLDVPGAPGHGVLTHGEAASIGPEETAALRRRAVDRDHVSLDVLLLAAATRVLGRWSGQRRLLFDVVAHGREAVVDGVDLSRTAGWLVLNVPVLFDTDPDADLAEQIPVVHDQLRAWSAEHGAGDNLLRFLSEDPATRTALAELPGSDVLFSYGGDIDPRPAERPLLGRPVEARVPDIDPAAVTPYALQFEALVVGGSIRAEIGYRPGQFHAATVRRLVDDWVREVRGLAGPVPPPTPED